MPVNEPREISINLNDFKVVRFDLRGKSIIFTNEEFYEIMKWLQKKQDERRCEGFYEG